MLISSLIAAIAAPVVAGTLNRYRGGGIVPVRLFDPPGHRRFWCAPLMAVLAQVYLPWHEAVFFGACWLLWATLPWGRWYSLGHWPREASGPPGFFERVIERIGDVSGRNDAACLFLRNIVALAPLAWLSVPAAMIVLGGHSLAYGLAWSLMREDQSPTGAGEWGAGIAWGTALVFGGLT